MSLSSKTTVSNVEPIPELQVRLFGPFTVRVQDAPLPTLRTRKGAWLFTLLLLKHQQPIDRTWLAATLWPDSDHPESLKNLRNTLTDLRRALGTQHYRIFSPTPATLCLDLTGADVDLIAFDACVQLGDHTALKQAVALYRGPLLEGCQEEWVVLERQQRQQACLEALETVARLELQAGQPAQAARYLRTCIGIDPFHETAQCALMTALAALGDYAAVTQVYRDFRLQLHEHLHTQPAYETTALYQAIRVRARQIAAGGASILPAPSLPRPLSNLSSNTLPEKSEDLPAERGALHNFPPPLTSFIGREKECAEIRQLLAQTRLLTLTGTGGSGKTRLALEVAGEQVAAYEEGGWLVELAALSDPSLVVQTVATVLSIREQPGVPLLQTLVSTLQSRSLLLVLDNCEHLLGACSALAAALLRSCPSVRLLATSRERLSIGGEQVYRVPPLSLPELNVGLSVESMHRYESVRLFVARACLIQSTFRVSAGNAGVLAQVCHRLDGLPLAIELAAARVRSLSLEELQRRLDDRFHLLTGGDRSALPRQQTLRALIDWSYDLLSEQEKQLLERLSVFAGGWTLDATEQVCAILPSLSPPDVLDLLTSLVDKSLVIAEEREGSVRYRMLETVRAYAQERLEESGESGVVRGCHLVYFLELAEAAAPKLRGPEQVRWLERLEAEHENLRTVLARSLLEARVGEAFRLCGALSRFWGTRGYLLEGREWCARALGMAGGQTRSQERAKALHGAGVLSWMLGDYTSARAYHEETLVIHREIGDRLGIAASLTGLGNVATIQGDYASAQSYNAESLAIRREIGDRGGIATSLNNLGMAALHQGDYVLARTCWRESLALYREIGDQSGIAYSLNNLGDMAHSQGDRTSARAFHEESLAIRREIGDRGGIAASLHNLGMVAYAQGDIAAVQDYSVESLAIYREIGNRGGIANSLDNLGNVAYAQGDYAATRTSWRESLTLYQQIGNRNGIAWVLQMFARLTAKESRWEQAALLWGAAEALREVIGSPLAPNERELYAQEVAVARQALNEETFTTAWAKGRVMTLDEVIASAL